LITAARIVRAVASARKCDSISIIAPLAGATCAEAATRPGPPGFRTSSTFVKPGMRWSSRPEAEHDPACSRSALLIDLFAFWKRLWMARGRIVRALLLWFHGRFSPAPFLTLCGGINYRSLLQRRSENGRKIGGNDGFSRPHVGGYSCIQIRDCD